MRRGVLELLIACVIVVPAKGTISFATANDAKLVSYGRHLSGECSACHRADGSNSSIPSITGWDPETFAATLNLYRSGTRQNPTMASVAQSLDDQQIKALAAFFASLPKSTAAQKK